MDLYPCQIFVGHDEMSKSKNNTYKRIYHMKLHMKEVNIGFEAYRCTLLSQYVHLYSSRDYKYDSSCCRHHLAEYGRQVVGPDFLWILAPFLFTDMEL